jgi:hypothetical protein
MGRLTRRPRLLVAPERAARHALIKASPHSPKTRRLSGITLDSARQREHPQQAIAELGAEFAGVAAGLDLLAGVSR